VRIFKSLDLLDRRNYDLVIPHLVGKLFSKLQHIEILARGVHFEGFTAKN